MNDTWRPMQRTPLVRVFVLVACGFIVGRLTPPLVVRAGGQVPQLSWTAALILGMLAVLVGGLAWSTWQALHKQQRRMVSAHALRLLALAKTGIVAGGVLVGFYGGYAVAYLDTLDTDYGRERVLHAGGAVVTAILLVVAAMLLERACERPGDDEDDDAESDSSSSPEPA